jgi:glutathione peroxidase
MRVFLTFSLIFLLNTGALMSENAYSYSFKDINEEDMINLSDYKGKTLVVVNTASLCGFTYQYDGLQKLYDDYKDQGLVVLGVPSNDFGNQESGTNSEVKEFCESTFSITFPLTEKNVVKGKDAHPFFKWSKKELGFIGGVPRWNFHKIIIGKDGNAIAGYTALTRPSSKKFISEIEKALQL